MAEEIELAAAVALIRDELMRAAAAGADDELRFEVGPIGMEFAVEMRRDVAVKAGFRAWVVAADAEGRAGRTRTHRVTLSLTPKRADGTPVEISHDPDDDPGGDADAPLFTPPEA
ncbi:trypco2 family protein [Streptomyces sp. NPDC002785]|uniref:trypco2 family protein n=1 Tax=Streptomyces sp. NPDC002785 TaxID=3154543 RepID=UPI0033347EBA